MKLLCAVPLHLFGRVIEVVSFVVACGKSPMHTHSSTAQFEISHNFSSFIQGPGWCGCSGCSCTHRFSGGLILHPHLRKDDIYTLDFHDFHSKVALLPDFQRISENLHPQSWNPNQGPDNTYLLHVARKCKHFLHSSFFLIMQHKDKFLWKLVIHTYPHAYLLLQP